MARSDRREHAVPGVGPKLAIEAHASAANARRKNLQAFAPVHPSHVGNANRAHAVVKGVLPAAPINASPSMGKPTPAPDVHSGATGRRISGRDTPGDASALPHHPVRGDRILDQVFDQGAVNNKIDGERHHSTVAAKGLDVPAISTDRLPAKPADSVTTPGSLIEQFRRWNNGDGC